MMQSDFPTVVDWRSGDSAHLTVTVPVVLYQGEQVALLPEVPETMKTIAVTVGGDPRDVVTTSPGPGECRVKVIRDGGRSVIQPILVFHASDAGASAIVDYYGKGGVITALLLSTLREWFQPLQGLSSIDELTAQYPPTTDTTKRGYPGDRAVIGKAIYTQLGGAWRQTTLVDPATGIVRELSIVETPEPVVALTEL